jgi:hypothetical protein
MGTVEAGRIDTLTAAMTLEQIPAWEPHQGRFQTGESDLFY